MWNSQYSDGSLDIKSGVFRILLFSFRKKEYSFWLVKDVSLKSINFT